MMCPCLDIRFFPSVRVPVLASQQVLSTVMKFSYIQTLGFFNDAASVGIKTGFLYNDDVFISRH